MPSLRNSRHFFSLPRQCIRSKTLPQRIVTVHHFSFANHISAFLCHSFASPCSAPPLPCRSVLLIATALHQASRCIATAQQFTSQPFLRRSRQCLCQSLPLTARLSRCHSAPYVAVAHLLKSRQCLCCSVPCSSSPSLGQSTRINAFAARNHSQPCHCWAYRCISFASQVLAVPCPCSQAFTS